MYVREEYLREVLSVIKPEVSKEINKETDKDSGDESMATLDRILAFCRSEVPERAPAKADNIYRICHAVAKQYGLYTEMRQMMKAKWGVKSMRDMDLEALQSLFYFMRGLEKIKRR
ncbi:hypothetical protein C4J81_16505 [Deltaproteobacteria bacterium Smac51]|nr:hypothetical protein C4J81_16505 [Deltaproteobacteria bacterium Smac51]